MRSELPPWSQQAAKFSGHKSCENEDIIFFQFVLWPHVSHFIKRSRDFNGSGDMVLVCHVVSEDHVINVSCDFMSGNLSW